MPGPFSSESDSRVDPRTANVAGGEAAATGVVTGNRSPVNVNITDGGVVQAGVDAIAQAAAAILGAADTAQAGVTSAAQINAAVSENATNVVADIAAGALRVGEDVFSQAIGAIASAGSYGSQLQSQALDVAEGSGARILEAAGLVGSIAEQSAAASANLAQLGIGANAALLDTFGATTGNLAQLAIGSNASLLDTFGTATANLTQANIQANSGLLSDFGGQLSALYDRAIGAASARDSQIADLATASLKPDAGAFNESLKVGAFAVVALVIAAIAIPVVLRK